MNEHFIGVDVGTGSVRAGVFDATGRLVATGKHPIGIRRDGDRVEQSSNEIWQAVVEAVRTAMKDAAIDPSCVAGMGFDATCSMVVVDDEGQPLSVSPDGQADRNVIVWMDHRSTGQAERINAIGHGVLDYVGGRISPEMETPKLLWLKENNPETFAKAAHFFDLPDFLTWRATGDVTRSLCSLTCKWTYLAHEERFDPTYFEAIGLGKIAREKFERIGGSVAGLAEPVGNGLSEKAAAEFGLSAGIAVSSSVIDAHCGGIGTMLAGLGKDESAEGPMGLIMGTSCCAMALTREPVFVEGVWGPYKDAMVPGYWLLEGGQSAYGAGIDHLISLHPLHAAMKADADTAGMSLPDYLEQCALDKAGSPDNAHDLAALVHVVPEFLGNRAPHADPHARATIAGLTLDASAESLFSLYVAGLCGLCYGTRQIIDATRAKGVGIDRLIVSGGAARSALLRRLLADATGLPVVSTETAEPVLLGGAMLGAVAAGRYASLDEAATAMSRIAETVEPRTGAAKNWHDRKFHIFEALQSTDREHRLTMAEAADPA